MPTINNNLLLKSKFDSNSFHIAIKFSLNLAQVLSYFPIDVNLSFTKFSWVSWRLLYSTFTLSVFVMELCLVVFQAFSSEFTLLNMDTLMFHLGGVIQYVLFLILARRWSVFVKEWQKVEFRMRNYKIEGDLKIKLNVLTGTIMTLALIEHVLVNIYKLIKCIREEPNIEEALRTFFITYYSYVFDVFNYSLWLGLLIQFTNLQRTFNWSYADVFIMLIGSAFTHRLKQVTRQIQLLSKGKTKEISQWSKVRQDYMKLSDLCGVINNKISSIIIVCFLLNLYFVLVQLFRTFDNISDLIEQIYFCMSFGLLIIRIVCVCMLGGSPYEEWRNIGFALNSVNSSAYNIEVERLTEQVITCELNLSGKNFFNVTKSLVLKIAGAIVTYELVLIQFYNIGSKNMTK